MRKLLTGASVILAAAMMAPMASANSTVGLHVGNIDYDSGGGGDADIYGLDGAWNHAFGDGWVLQTDGQIDRLDVGVDLGTGYASVAAGVRNDSYSIYAFLGQTDLIGEAAYQIGLGGQLYMGSFVIGGDAGHEEFQDAGFELNQLNANATWFVVPDFGLTAEITSGSIDSSGPEADIEGYGVGALWRFSGSPVSLSARFRHDEIDDGTSEEVDTWLIGVNLNFGTATAQEQFTQGPSWNGARNLYERGLLLP